MVPDSPVQWGPVDPVALSIGCALGCRTEIHAGPVPVPFGVALDRGARARMDDTERAITSAGLTVDGSSPGLSVGFEPAPGWSLDTAVLADSVKAVGAGGPRPPDLAARLGYERGLLSIGGSVWSAGASDDRAYAVDASLLAGWWTAEMEVVREHIADVTHAFADPVNAKQVDGDGISLRVQRDLGLWWSVELGGESRVFLKRTGTVVVPPWVRGVADLRFDPVGPVRWTVVELALTESIGSTMDDVRVGTQVDLGRGRGRGR